MGSRPAQPDELPSHRLPLLLFEEFCTEAVSEESMAVVGAAQYSRRRLSLRALFELATEKAWIVGPLDNPERAWRILASVEEQEPDIVRELIMYPTVGTWAGRCLRQAIRSAFGAVPLWSEFGYLHSLAAAAAVRSGFPCDISVPVLHGVVTLPTMGQVKLPSEFPIGLARLHNTRDETRIRAAGGRMSIGFSPSVENPQFSPARRYYTTAEGIELDVAIDDSDPYREFSTPRPPSRLDSVEFTEWCKLLDEAWQLLTRWHRGCAHELSAGLVALVPIAPVGNVIGASSPAAFGEVALSVKNSATALAETLVHEIQHSKLNALTDLIELHTSDPLEQLYAPWRNDPRPLSGLLHGAYAFISVIEFWQVQRNLVAEQERPQAQFDFAYRRHQVRQAVEIVLSCGGLTELGHQFVLAIAARLASCERVTVASELLASVASICDDHRAGWRIQHVRPDAGYVAELAAAWLGGTPVPHWHGRRSVVAGTRSVGSPTRMDLLKAKATDPGTFARLASQAGKLPGRTPHADAAYALGDNKRAIVAYCARVATTPDDGHAWVGLGLSLRADGAQTAARTLLEIPETALAVHLRLLALGAVHPDPIALATWLGTDLGPAPVSVE